MPNFVDEYVTRRVRLHTNYLKTPITFASRDYKFNNLHIITSILYHINVLAGIQNGDYN